MKEKVMNFIHSKNFIVILIILLLLLVVVTATYAWFTWSSTENTSVTMSIGKASDVVFKTGNDISTNNLSPVFNYTDGEKTSFSIINRDTTGASLKYTINLNITTISDELKNNNLKYKLLQGSNVVNEGDFSTITNNSTITMYSDNLTTGTTNFTFYLYIDGNKENSLDLMNKSITGTITVSVEENIEPLATTITNLYVNAEKTTVTNNSITYNTAPSVNLMNDRLGGTTSSLDGGNIRYYGASPNNYIYFNCSDYSNQSDSTCELWRIIGVFEGKVKIMRNETIGSLAWDLDKNIDSSLTTYDNDWTTASLQVLLNQKYYNGDTSGTITYYSGTNGNTSTSLDMSSIGIKNDITRNLISDTIYYLGGWNSSEIYSDQFYSYERGTTVYSGMPTTWTGKIALPYPSDYGYASDLESCTENLYDYYDTTYTPTCPNVNWMTNIFTNNESSSWLLTPNSDESSTGWYVHRQSQIISSMGFTCGHHYIIPVLYLDSELGIESGTGTSSDPYKLSV